MIPRRRPDIRNFELFKLLSRHLKYRKGDPHKVREWESVFSEFLGVKYSLAVSSGRHAMELILKALRLDAGSEVIIPAYTLKDLIPIITTLGLKPVPADIDPHTFDIDPEKIEHRINERTKVLLVAHLFGNPCRMTEIAQIAKKRSLYLIEDCAHSLGSSFKGLPTGTLGDASFFSFETIKPVNTYGGGMIATNNCAIAERAEALIKQDPGYRSALLKKAFAAEMERILLPTPLSYFPLYLLSSDTFKNTASRLYRRLRGPVNKGTSYLPAQAHLGIDKIKDLKERVRIRRIKAELLTKNLGPKVFPQMILEDSQTNYYFFTALLPSEASPIRKKLLLSGIDSGIENELADNCANLLGYTDCVNMNKIYKNVIHLPLYESISNDNILHIARTLNKIVSI